VSQQAVPRAAWCVIVACSAAVFFANLRFGPSALWIVSSDDFFYYAQVARNLAMHGLSSFDGIHLTNGYHPLWLLTLALATKLFAIGGWLDASTDLPLAAAFDAILFALAMTIAYFVYRLLRQHCGTLASCSIQMLATLYVLLLLRSGMEVGLVLATLFALLYFRLRSGFCWSAHQCFFYGLIAATVTLSRLDSLLLVALLFVFDLLPNAARLGSARRCTLWFSVGMTPVALYLLSNLFLFHTLLPISGAAKQLRWHPYLPSLAALRSLLPFLTWQTFFLFGLCLLLVIAALARIAFGRQRIPRDCSSFFCILLLFPFLHLYAVTSLSDWGVWPWYLYPWLPAAVLAATLLFANRKDPAAEQLDKNRPINTGQRPLAQMDRYLAALACFFASGFYLIFWSYILVNSGAPLNNPMVATAVELRQFAHTHPGIYAMGDRAGAVGYLAPMPVIQLEGLMMDKPFLDNIRHQRDLQDVLHDYGVRYYIATFRSETLHSADLSQSEINHLGISSDGCYHAKEPAQAGPDSPAMRTHLCQSPVAVFHHGDYVNDLFDMQPDPSQH